jgi:hypothetical protein
VLWPAVAAAAVVLVAVGLYLRPRAAEDHRPLDIVDAYRLARRLDAGEKPSPREWDRNGDGVVDRKDVETIARACVALGGER